jgi:hypothetical protein
VKVIGETPVHPRMRFHLCAGPANDEVAHHSKNWSVQVARQ